MNKKAPNLELKGMTNDVVCLDVPRRPARPGATVVRVTNVENPTNVVNPNGFGVHLTLDGYGGSQEQLSDLEHVRRFLSQLPEQLGMHKLMEPAVQELGALSPKDPGGVSGFVMIAESHISAHTFPLRGFISADVYTCQNCLETRQICRYFIDAFGLQDLEVNLVRRGTRYPDQNIYDAPQPAAPAKLATR
ncbi:MAG: S-adenosylmethionine decarboxylase [Pseudomonadota bacterium]